MYQKCGLTYQFHGCLYQHGLYRQLKDVFRISFRLEIVYFTLKQFKKTGGMSAIHLRMVELE